jgi:RNA polymerase sigma-70 factor (ECF subfamily)
MLNVRAYTNNAHAGSNRQSKSHYNVASDSNIVGAMSEAKISDFESGNEWNPANFETIISQYQTRIYRFIYSIVGDVEIAHDLTQDTFLNAYRNLIRRQENHDNPQPGHNGDNISAWLYTIARNTAFSEMRRRKIVRFFSFWQRSNDKGQDEEYNGLAENATNEPGGGMENRSILSDELERAINTVGRQRLTALLLHIDGFSYKEICQITGDSLSSVKSQIFRAKESLRKVLSGTETLQVQTEAEGDYE